jgi:hypothetical protein
MRLHTTPGGDTVTGPNVPAAIFRYTVVNSATSARSSVKVSTHCGASGQR